jgi:hypothetical protein
MMPQIETVSVRTVRAIHWQGEELGDQSGRALRDAPRPCDPPAPLAVAAVQRAGFKQRLSVRQERLLAAVWGGPDYEPENAVATLKVMVSQLRRWVGPLGIAIMAMHGEGYRIELRAAPVTAFGYGHARLACAGGSRSH